MLHTVQQQQMANYALEYLNVVASNDDVISKEVPVWGHTDHKFHGRETWRSEWETLKQVVKFECCGVR